MRTLVLSLAIAALLLTLWGYVALNQAQLVSSLRSEQEQLTCLQQLLSTPTPEPDKCRMPPELAQYTSEAQKLISDFESSHQQVTNAVVSFNLYTVGTSDSTQKSAVRLELLSQINLARETVADLRRRLSNLPTPRNPRAEWINREMGQALDQESALLSILLQSLAHGRTPEDDTLLPGEYLRLHSMSSVAFRFAKYALMDLSTDYQCSP